MNVKKYLAAVLCFCLLMCGCGPTAYENTWSSTKPVRPSTATSEPQKSADEWNELMSYGEYLALPAAERSTFVDSFETAEEFTAWLQAVKKIYDAEQKDNSIGNDGVIDMGKIDP